MATTVNKIEEALSILNNHDWYWMMCDSNSAYGYARGSMRAFVELVATIDDAAIVKAMRDLWTANISMFTLQCLAVMIWQRQSSSQRRLS